MDLVFDSNPVSFSKVLFMIKVGSPILLDTSGSHNRTLPAGSLCLVSSTFLGEFQAQTGGCSLFTRQSSLVGVNV